MALQAKRVALDPQQMIVLSAVRLVAGGATLPECGLMMHRFLALIRDIAMAAQANLNPVRFGKSRLAAGMGAVAVGAIARRARMLELLRFRSAWPYRRGRLRIVSWHRLRQNNFPILGWRVADLALFVCEGRMHEFRHELRRGRLVRIVTAKAIGGFERLVLVRFLQVRVFYVMAIDTERGRRLGQVEVKLGACRSRRSCG